MKLNWRYRLARWLSAWAWDNEIQTCNGLAVLKGLEMDDDKLDMTFEQDPALAQYIGKCFACMVASSPNYTEMQFELRGKYKGVHQFLTVTILKHNGKTPHQLRQEAEKERDELRLQLNQQTERDKHDKESKEASNNAGHNH